MSVERIFDQFPLLDVNETFYLRQITQADAADYLEYLSNTEVHRFVPDECLPRDIEQAHKEVQYHIDLYRYKRSISWSLAKKSDHKIVGSCGFNYWNRDHARTEISYDLARPYWGKGLMTEVVKTVLAFGFTQMRLHRVEATVAPDNIGSVRVLRKAGFKKEGLLREQKLLHGKFCDAIILSILQREYLGF